FLVVLEPSHESMEMAKFMNELAIEVGRPMLTVVNMVDEDIAENVKASMKSIDIDVNAFFPRDKRIAAVNLSGEPVPLLPEFMPLLRSCLDAISNKVRGGVL
ncbi:MAG: cobalamin biosynthesis protein CobU, partial [Acetomicrobium sp.]